MLAFADLPPAECEVVMAQLQATWTELQEVEVKLSAGGRAGGECWAGLVHQ